MKLQDVAGSYALLEISLLLLVIIPTIIVFLLTKDKKKHDVRSDSIRARRA